jgi:RNase H-fold protein (predicted Holliday junction resolvase)
MMEAGLDHAERKEHVDAIAAVFILQGYMDSRR